jgi:N-methylhydantoinase A
VEDALKGRRIVDYALEGLHETRIYAGELLEPGMQLEGPAIIETTGATTVLHPLNELTVDDYGNLVISITPTVPDGGDQ